MTAPVLTAVVLVALIAAAATWVLQDARERAQARRPVVAVLLGVSIDRPEVWAVLCLLGSVIFVPMYLVARRVD